jgi:hypothetical protein
MIGIGSGNGTGESAFASAGWKVLATDVNPSSLRTCREKGLPALQFDPMTDQGPGMFQAIYADGVFGHLWVRHRACVPAWQRLAKLGAPGAVCLISNDLADRDESSDFAVRTDGGARFYRPPAGALAEDAAATGQWKVRRHDIYEYERKGRVRRRELVIAELLMDERVEPKN